MSRERCFQSPRLSIHPSIHPSVQVAICPFILQTTIAAAVQLHPRHLRREAKQKLELPVCRRSRSAAKCTFQEFQFHFAQQKATRTNTIYVCAYMYIHIYDNKNPQRAKSLSLLHILHYIHDFLPNFKFWPFPSFYCKLGTLLLGLLGLLFLLQCLDWRPSGRPSLSASSCQPLLLRLLHGLWHNILSVSICAYILLIASWKGLCAVPISTALSSTWSVSGVLIAGRLVLADLSKPNGQASRMFIKRGPYYHAKKYIWPQAVTEADQ